MQSASLTPAKTVFGRGACPVVTSSSGPTRSLEDDDLALEELAPEGVQWLPRPVGCAGLPERPAIRLRVLPTRRLADDRRAGHPARERQRLVHRAVEDDAITTSIGAGRSTPL